MTQDIPRRTYARVDELEFRTRSASSLLGVSDITLRTYSEKSGITVPRATKGVPVRLRHLQPLPAHGVAPSKWLGEDTQEG